MEVMADEVRHCLLGSSFGSHPLFAFRGIKTNEFVLRDETQLANFLSLSEHDKKLCANQSYKAHEGNILDWLETQWRVRTSYEGDYVHEYMVIENDATEDM